MADDGVTTAVNLAEHGHRDIVTECLKTGFLRASGDVDRLHEVVGEDSNGLGLASLVRNHARQNVALHLDEAEAVVVPGRVLGHDPDGVGLTTGDKQEDAIVSYMDVCDGGFIFIESELLN